MHHKRRRGKNARSSFRMNFKTVKGKLRDEHEQEQRARVSEKEQRAHPEPWFNTREISG